MNYTVVWLPEAEDELATLWMTSARRDAVTRAVAELDRRLGEHGPDEGESRPAGYRVTFVPPLAILFRVDTDERTVAVGRVWEYG